MRVRWRLAAEMFEMVVRDVRHACRRLGRSPAFTIVASLSLALGIGANTAAFGVLYAALLRPLPVRDPGSLAVVAHANQLSMSYPAYVYLRDHSSSLDGLAAFRQTPGNLAMDGTTERVTAMLVSGNYFDMLGVDMSVGSPIRADDDLTPGSGGARGPVAVISHQMWTRRFGGDASIVGRAIRVNGQPFTVIGVAPPEFRGTRVGVFPDVFVPFAFAVPLTAIPNALSGPDNNWIRLIGRVKPEVGFAQATAEVTATFQRFTREQLLARLPSEESRRRALERAMAVTPGGAGLFESRGVESSLYISMGLMGVVLLLACVNVANLLVARAERYHRDTAIHLALGASRARVWSQTMVESLLLGVLGVAAGLVLAIWMRGLLAQLIPAREQMDLSMDATVVILSAIGGLVAAVCLGALTMWHSARREVTRALKGEDLTTRLWLRKGLIVGQLALSVVVLVAAALFGQTLRNLALIDPGFERERVLIASLDPSGHTPQEQTTFYERLLDDVRASPGVVSAALSGAEPLSTSMGWRFSVRRGGTGAVEAVNSWVAIVSPDYFKTMGIPILRGTDLRRHRDAEGPTRSSGAEAPWPVLVNETFATRFLGDQDPVGVRVSGNGTMRFDIVGVVKDSATIGIRERKEPVIYVPFGERLAGPLVLHVRAAVPPAGLIATVEVIAQRVASDVPIFAVRTIDQQIDRFMGRERTFARLTSIFGVLALLLSAVGLYGLIAYAVSRRTKELGIRVALGAEPARLLRMVLREATLLVIIGVALGVPLAAALASTIASLLYGVQPGDWRSLTGAVMVLLGVALLATWVPARRAARVDPLVALRHE